MPKETNRHLQAVPGAELRDFGYPKVANAAALPTLTVDSIGTIYTMSDTGISCQMTAVDAWRPLNFLVVDAAGSAASTVAPTTPTLLGTELIVENVGLSGEPANFWAYPKTTTILWKSRTTDHPDIEVVADVPAASVPTWDLTQPPVGATWTDRSVAATTLTLVGAPTVTGSGVVLSFNQSITGPVMTQPADTFEIVFDLTTAAAPVNGDRMFTTKVDIGTATTGVEIFYSGTGGNLIVRVGDGSSTATSTAVAAGLSTRSIVTLRKTLTDIQLIVGASSTSVARPGPVVAGAGGSFTINGLHSNPALSSGDVTIHSIAINEGA